MPAPRAVAIAVALIGIHAAAAQPVTETILHTFGCPPKGARPIGLIRDSAGNIYGTTMTGGTWNSGVVFKLSASGHFKVLYSFTGGADGGTPKAGVVRDSAGNLYGTTNSGGAAGLGVVYEVDASGHQTVLHSFAGGGDGESPSSGVIRDASGNLYGTTSGGGARNGGTVYRIDMTGQETIVHNFPGGMGGYDPEGGVIMDSAGNLYGTTRYGGYHSGGLVYEIGTTGHYKILYLFHTARGGRPATGVLRDHAGNLYGTTTVGGRGQNGVVYRLSKTGHEKVLYAYSDSDNESSSSGLTRDAAGNLYGTASGGQYDAGLIYKIDTTGVETAVYSFTGGADGRDPESLVSDAAGNLYGVTYDGGAGAFEAGPGVLYKVDTASQQSVLYTFPQNLDGANPNGAVAFDAAGNLYGTADMGGAQGVGTIYKIDTAGHFTTLYSFTPAGGDYPLGGVVLDTAGDLYGTTSSTVFKLDSSGHQAVLYSFTGGADGGLPPGPLTRDAAGNLYGTTFYGGTANMGVVYKIDPSGQETVLHSFSGAPDGCHPSQGVILDSAGNLYGAAGCGASNRGVVFEINTIGQESIMCDFAGSTDGAYPVGLTLDSAGNLYGATAGGGASGAGTVFKVDRNGNQSVLYSFTGGVDGKEPYSGVTLDSTGNIYGTTLGGGGSNVGVVYKVDSAGTETVLHTFSGGADGGSPFVGITLDPSGNIFGTTNGGGKANTGVVFKLSPNVLR